jgi:hypothetical protein
MIKASRNFIHPEIWQLAEEMLTVFDQVDEMLSQKNDTISELESEIESLKKEMEGLQ